MLNNTKHQIGKNFNALFPLLVFLPLLFTNVFPDTQLTHKGVTWYFSENHTTGQYINGDPWVIGPVTITDISPKPATGRNGTMLNPTIGRTQAFDSRISAYHPYETTLNVGLQLPLTANPNDSIVSSISKSEDSKHEQISTFSILTIVGKEPAYDEFRPSPINRDYNKSFHESDINYTRLNILPKSELTVHSIDLSIERFSETWFEKDLTWTGRYLHPHYMGEQNGYGKGIAIMTGTAVLQLQLDYPSEKKRELAILLLQYGLDIHATLALGNRWDADGGHNPGRFAPAFLAAALFNDKDMLYNISSEAMAFQELQQTFYVTQSDVSIVHDGNKPPYLQYEQTDIGMPEWGIRHSSKPSTDNRYWSAAYRYIAGGVLIAPYVAASLMNLKETINHDAFFDYAKRHLFYRLNRFKNPKYYNGFDDGNGYGEGPTINDSPFSSNDIPGFHQDFFLAFEHILNEKPTQPSSLEIN